MPLSATTWDAGAQMFVPCTNLSGFETQVLPQLIEYCGPKCHDQGKLQATGTWNLKGIGTVPLTAEVVEQACGASLAKVKPSAIPQSALLLKSDPLVNDDHDFKFETPEATQAFTAAVMAWLQVELGATAGEIPGGGEPLGGGMPVGSGVPTDAAPGSGEGPAEVAPADSAEPVDAVDSSSVSGDPLPGAGATP